MKQNWKKIGCLLVCALFVFFSLPLRANADTGPKPSVHILFQNMGDELCYGTLLSKTPSTGPSSVWNGVERDAYHKDNYASALLDYKTWKAFVDYADADGYYFLQHSVWQVNEKKSLSWTYYPPNDFKILLYYPETGTFAVSGVCKRYAFDTYYAVDMQGVEIGSVRYDEDLSNNDRTPGEEGPVSDRLDAKKAYQWQQETVSLVARILITIAIEMGVALLFGFRGKKALVLLAIVNTATQIILNVLLNLIHFTSGAWAFVTGYILLELAVFAMEAALYSVMMKRIAGCEKPTRFYVLYALVANAVSFGAGMGIAKILPGIF